MRTDDSPHVLETSAIGALTGNGRCFSVTYVHCTWQLCSSRKQSLLTDYRQNIKQRNKFNPDISWRRRGEIEVHLHSISISALAGGEGRGLAPNVVPVEKRLGGLQSRLNMFIDEEISSHSGHLVW